MQLGELSRTKKVLKKVSKRLRKTMEDKNLIFPDQRVGLTPYSLMCADCGNVKVFNYDTISRAVITIRDNAIEYDFGRIINQDGLSKTEKVIVILERHGISGSALWKEMEKKQKQVNCAKCSSDNIVLYGDVLLECYMNRCIGCLKCGGAFNEENIEEYCKQCLSLRSTLSHTKEEKALFFLHLDMDLYCDACPIQAVREDYGIMGDQIKRGVSGKLV